MTNLPQDRSGWQALLKRVARATGDSQNAEDHLHAAFLRLQQYSRANVVDNPVGFLLRTAVNLSTDGHRQDQVRNEHASQIAGRLQLNNLAPLQDEVLEAHRLLEAVRIALAELTPRTREVFLMHRLEGLKYREIAERLGITMSAVEKHIAKGALHLLMTFGER